MTSCRAAISAFGLLLGVAHAQSNMLFISDNVMTGLTWHAATNPGSGGSGSCAPTAGLVQYFRAPFHTDTTAGSYTLSLYYQSFQSGFVYLYQDQFDPQDPCVGIIAFGRAPIANLQNIQLDAGRQYWFVTSEDVLYGGGGSFQVTIRGPAGSHLVRGNVPALTSPVASISLVAGGTQPWNLDAGPAHAAEFYLVLGSASGTTPGIDLPRGFNLPLEFDSWLLFTASSANLPPLVASFGVLDGAGSARGGLSVPPGSPAALAGTELDHAFIAFLPNGAITLVSAALPLQLVR